MHWAILPDSFKGLMSAAFLLGTPTVIGALTILGLKDKNPSILRMMFSPWITVALMLFGCAITLLEGSICLVIMAPLFLLLASIGGLVMGLTIRFTNRTRSELSSVALLPMLMLMADSNLPVQPRVLELRRSVEVKAPPQVIWKEILEARNIHPEELPLSFPHLIGVPKPVEGINFQTPEGEVRQSRWEKGVNFVGIVTSRDDNHSIGWRYAFNAHSFPKGSMDDHVAIGGKYYDILDTTFNLTPADGQVTRLEIVAHYKVNSCINFYAIPISRWMGNSFIDSILGLYKSRSEHRHSI